MVGLPLPEPRQPVAADPTDEFGQAPPFAGHHPVDRVVHQVCRLRICGSDLLQDGVAGG